MFNLSWLTRRLGDEERIRRARPRLALDDDRAVLYAVGDVHGCFDQLVKLEAMILADGERFPERTKIIVMLGDLIDRGPRSADVVDHVLRPLPAGFQRIVLAGNHEEALLAFLDDPRRDEWLRIGGIETLASYGVPVGLGGLSRAQKRLLALSARASIPEEHIAFLRGLPISLVWGGYLLVHAGIRPGRSIEEQTDLDLTGIRDAFTANTSDHGSVIVHGHSPTVDPERRPNRIAVDTGAYATGRLAAVRLDGQESEFMLASG